MKRIPAIILCLCMLFAVLCSCSTSKIKTNEKVKIVVTIFPEYDWVREIMGENFRDAEVSFLLDSGTDLHNYQPTAQDIALLSGCDLFVYIGGESDEWVEDALSSAGSTAETLCMMEVVDALDEELAEGMQADHEEDEHSHEHEEDGAKDEHLWLSLRNAQVMVNALLGSLCTLMPQYEQSFRSNAKRYCDKLAELDEQYIQMCENAVYHTILVADRFPFRYLAEDYQLTYYAAFPGCAAASDISFETISFLADKLAELNLPAVLSIDGSDGAICGTVIEAAGVNAKTLVLNSCQCVSSKELQDGITYYDIMVSNLNVLQEVLN